MWDWKQKESSLVTCYLLLYPEGLDTKDKYLSSETLDHKVRKISRSWMNARINKNQRTGKQTSWHKTILDKCTGKMCQANSDIFLQRKNYRSINGNFYFNDSIQLLSWLLKAFGCHRQCLSFSFTHEILKLKGGCSNKGKIKGN